MGNTQQCGVDGDCDGLADREPVAELCNGIDDDCDGETDEDLLPAAPGAVRYYRDHDSDGFGDVNSDAWLCKAETGWVENFSDCDDTRASDNPDAEEICGDAFDNDCDGILEDPDDCGLTPIQVPDVSQSQYPSATLGKCGADSGKDPSVDVIELLAKQDTTRIKFTVRLAGAPATDSCSLYRLGFAPIGQSSDDMVYLLRLSAVPCASAGLNTVEVFHHDKPISSTVSYGFNAADPGHVSFTIAKDELLPQLPSPSYRVRACTTLTADGKGLCSDDACEVRVHR